MVGRLKHFLTFPERDFDKYQGNMLLHTLESYSFNSKVNLTYPTNVRLFGSNVMCDCLGVM